MLNLLGLLPGMAALTAIPYVGPALALVPVAWKLINSPIGRAIGIGVVGAGLYVVGDLHGHRVVRDEWNAANHAATVAAKKRDDEIDAAIQRSAEQAQADSQKQTAELERKVQDYETQLAKRDQKTDDCTISRDDVKRLRRLK